MSEYGKEIRIKGIGGRINTVIKHLYLNQAKFGDKIGLSQSHISGLVNETKNLTIPVLKLICLVFNVNDHWLKTGEGEMFEKRVPSIAGFDNVTADIVFALKLMDEKGKKDVLEYVEEKLLLKKALRRIHEIEKRLQISSPEMRSIEGERRKLPRIVINDKVEFSIKDHPITESGMIIDRSDGGFRMVTSYPLLLGQEIDIKSEREDLPKGGIVKWMKEEDEMYIIGLQVK